MPTLHLKGKGGGLQERFELGELMLEGRQRKTNLTLRTGWVGLKENDRRERLVGG